MQDWVLKRFDEPDERRSMPRGSFELVRLGGLTLGRARYEPGWRWSEHVGRSLGAALCRTRHVGWVLAGRSRVRMESGSEFEMKAGDLFAIGPGHDAWVVGDEAYVSLHLLGAEEYAR